ncbi:hypothetical protein LJC26_07945 [Desulfovibrio sp. OttesenSCG-928-O18]|nr:hypothetical protein [Desulfovibrio sp. OttesenSCG-928-O18]
MKDLRRFSGCDIDWDLSPEQAVTMYLEWGNNDWRGRHAPVRSKTDYSTYFVIDAWENPPLARLIRRNSENAEELAALTLPEHLRAAWEQEYGKLKGVFEPTAAIKEWLRSEVYGG